MTAVEPRPEGPNPLDSLTEKQREVLDLLLEHKTSKEISRKLGISPHTVDQRMTQARVKLGLANRGEVANAYRRLKEMYEGATYQFSYMDKDAYLVDSRHSTDEDEPETEHPADDAPIADRVLVLLVLGGVSMFVMLSHLTGN